MALYHQSRWPRYAIVGYAVVVAMALSTTTALARSQVRANLHVEGTWAGLQLGLALVKDFGESHDGLAASFDPSDGDQVLKRVGTGGLDVGMVLESQIPAGAKKPGIDSFPVGRYVVCVVTNSENPVRKVTVDELRKIFRGEMTSWREVPNGWVAEGIELYSPLLVSLEGQVFQRNVMRNTAFARSLQDLSIQPLRQKRSASAVMGAVAKKRGAIGFILFSFENRLDRRVRILGIAKDEKSPPVLPSLASIKDHSYPLTDALVLCRRVDTPAATEFCKFATGPEEATLVKHFNLFPNYEWEHFMGQARLKDVKAHRGAEIAGSGSAAWRGLMKDLGAEASRAKTAVQVQYHAATQAEAIGQFVEGGDLFLLDATLGDDVDSYERAWTNANPRQVPVGSIAAAIVVHPANALAALSFRQLRDLYAGKVKDWKELSRPEIPELILPDILTVSSAAAPAQPSPGGQAAATGQTGGGKQNKTAKASPSPAVRVGKRMIVPHPARTSHASNGAKARSTTTAARKEPTPAGRSISMDRRATIPTELLEAKLAVGKGHVNVLHRNDSAKVIESVAHDPLAIGLIDLAKLAPGDASVKVLAISPPTKAPIPPSRLRIPEGYPLVRAVSLFVSDRASQSAKDLADFLATGECAVTIARHGIIPTVMPTKKELAKAEVKAVGPRQRAVKR